MLQRVDVGVQAVEAYEPLVGRDAIEELKRLAQGLQGRRLLHLNSTLYGGGVAEMLRSLVPLYQGLGIDCEWRVIRGDEGFFRVSKGFHNALQGAPYELAEEARDLYRMHSQQNASHLEGDYDFVVIHDPQPLGIPYFLDGSGSKWIWRCHIDTSEPNPTVLAFLLEFLDEYDTYIFTTESFVPPGLRERNTAIIAPGIDPLSPKNMDLSPRVCERVVSWMGVDPKRPLLTQASRFDPWKDPMGVIEVYRRVRQEVPGLQLALLGSMPLDDPQGWEIYRAIVQEVGDDPDMHVLINLNMEVNAFQRHSDVVIQKSIREGFGLVVSETLWKETPVVAAPAGGIPLQMEDGVGGFLARTTEEYVERIIYLLRTPGEAARIGKSGRERIRQRFLITRLLADELRLLLSL